MRVKLIDFRGVNAPISLGTRRLFATPRSISRFNRVV